MLSEIDQFVNWIRRRNPEARTWKDYGYDLRQFADLLGDPDPPAVTFRDIDRFVNHQVSRGFQPTTINRRLATLVSFFTFLSAEDPTSLPRPAQTPLPARTGAPAPPCSARRAQSLLCRRGH